MVPAFRITWAEISFLACRRRRTRCHFRQKARRFLPFRLQARRPDRDSPQLVLSTVAEAAKILGVPWRAPRRTSTGRLGTGRLGMEGVNLRTVRELVGHWTNRCDRLASLSRPCSQVARVGEVRHVRDQRRFKVAGNWPLAPGSHVLREV
jgi:hypothetical protein